MNKEKNVKEPLVSVLMPVYNVERYVGEAIVSILNQTYSKFELIVVDDCSTDRTVEVIKGYAAKDTRVKLFLNMDKSYINALNYGLDNCNGEYIVRMDGDDIAQKLKIEKQLDYLLNNSDVHLVGCDVRSIDENGHVLNHVTLSHSVDVTHKLLRWRSPVLHIWMCKKTIYDELGGYREVGGSEDYDFLLRMDSLGYKFTNLQFEGYSVRIRNGNFQSTAGLRQRKIVYYIRKLYRERKLNRSMEDSFSVAGKMKTIDSSFFHERVHRISVLATNKFMYYRSIKRYDIMFCYGIIAIISPYQLLFFLESYIARLLTKQNK